MPSALSIKTALNDLAAEFELLGDWEERYQYVIDLGRSLAPLTTGERSDANKVRGCASQVWLVTEPQADGTLKFRGDSDAHIVRGLSPSCYGSTLAAHRPRSSGSTPRRRSTSWGSPGRSPPNARTASSR